MDDGRNWDRIWVDPLNMYLRYRGNTNGQSKQEGKYYIREIWTQLSGSERGRATLCRGK